MVSFAESLAMASTLLTKPFPSRPPLASRLHFSSRSLAVYRHRGAHLSTCSCTGNLLLQKSFRELSVSVNVVGGGGDTTSIETSSKVGSSFHLFQNVQNGMDNLTPQPKSRVFRGKSPVCASSSRDSSGGLGHESNVYMDGYAPPHSPPDRYGGPVEGHYGGEDRGTGSSSFSGIQGDNISPGTNPSDGYRPADVYASDSSPLEESNPVHPGTAQQNSTSQPSPSANRPPPEVPRTAGTYRTPLSTNSPLEGGFNRSQASPSRPYSTSTGSVERSYRPIESAGSPSNPSYSPQQPGNIYRPPQGGSVYPQQQQQQPGYSADTNRPGQDSRFNTSYRPEALSAGRNFDSVPPSRQSGSPRGGNYSNTQGNVRPGNFNTAQEGTNARAPSSNGAGSNDVPHNASKSPTDREPSAAAAVIDKYLGPSTLKLEKQDSSSPPPPPPRRKYPNTTEKKSGKDLVAESAACAVIEKYLGPWPGFPPRDPKIDEYLDSLPENAACAAIDKYFGPYKPLFVFKKNEGENANNGPATSRPPRNRNTSRSGPRSRTWNPSQGASTSRPWTPPPSQVSTDGQDRSPPQGGGASDRRPTGPSSEDV